jgi:hypothetical protein
LQHITIRSKNAVTASLPRLRVKRKQFSDKESVVALFVSLQSAKVCVIGGVKSSVDFSV